jgi:hypothetical protein
MDRQLISEADAFLWLSREVLNGQAESDIIAAQDLALKPKYRATKILQTDTDSQCRLSAV